MALAEEKDRKRGSVLDSPQEASERRSSAQRIETSERVSGHNPLGFDSAPTQPALASHCTQVTKTSEV